MKNYEEMQAKVWLLMHLLVEYARYQTPEKPIKDLKAKIESAAIRTHAGSIGVLAICAFNEIQIAKNSHQKIAARITLHKITSFWNKKPKPRTDLPPINIKNLEQEYERAA